MLLSFRPRPDAAKGHRDFARCWDSWPSEQGAEAPPGTASQARGMGRGGHQTRYHHPCSASSHCWGTGRPCVAANLNLICVFCLNAGAQPRSVHSLSQLSLTVLCTPKMAGKKSASTNIHINIAEGKKILTNVQVNMHMTDFCLLSHTHTSEMEQKDNSVLGYTNTD